MKVASLVVFVIATASVFGWLVAIQQVSIRVAQSLLSISDNPIIVLWILNLMLLLVEIIVPALVT